MTDQTATLPRPEPAYLVNHRNAMKSPRGPEEPIVRMYDAWRLYAQNHQRRYESPIGHDGVMGPAWASIGSAIIDLLNGETGRIDCGTLDHVIRTYAVVSGWGSEL